MTDWTLDTLSRAQTIDQPSDREHSNRVGGLEGRNQIGILDLVPAQIVLQRGLEDAQDLAIHVILGHAEQK